LNVSVTVYAATREIAQGVLAEIATLFPTASKDEGTIRVKFWSLGQHGPSARHRDLDARRWSEIEQNYPSVVRDAISAMHTKKFDNAAGKLVLWHGEPGTGKTTAIRALAQEWREWASFNYILDPERFFGSDADYMMEVLMQREHEIYFNGNGTPEVATNKQWHIVVLEDTSELLGKDARQTSGQGLARLLNICDGMVGQGLNILVLITSNEDIGAMHEAVTRPGRCAANISFREFTKEEAREWMALRDPEYPMDSLNRNYSLAELFALASGEMTQKSAAKSFGF
jgi:SpoVK/Ycf46/Vps4 family AAA+-type ATPase